VTDVSRALAFLGFNSISMLVLGTSVFSSFEIRSAPYFNVLEFWRHSLASAIAAEMIARKLKVSKPEDAFTCGLLHDIGKIAMFKVAPDDLKLIVNKAKSDGISFLDAETALEFPGHTVLGERLAEKWQLPVIIRKTIRYHHRDIEHMESIYPQMKPLIMIAALGNIMAKRFKIGESGDSILPEYPNNYLRFINLTPTMIKDIEASMEKEMDRASSFLSASLSG
jgi:putative nucleotidyltransferase with HDIG domain